MRTLLALFFLSLFTSSSLIQASEDDPLCVYEPIIEEQNCQEYPRFTLLYLKPSIDDSHYVLSSFDNTFNGSLYPKGKRHQNTTSFTPGFSVEGQSVLCPNTSALALSYTYFQAHSSASTSGDFLYDTNGFPGFGSQDSPVYRGTARSKNSYLFHAADVAYHRCFARLFPEQFTFVLGLDFAFIQFKEHTTSTGTFTSDSAQRALRNNLKRTSQFFGVGPEIGLRYEHLLPNLCSLPGEWSVNGKAKGSLLCGYTKSDLRYITLRTGPGGVSVLNGDVWRVIPSASADLGIAYHFQCAPFNSTLEIGYEWMVYSQCISKVTGLDTAFAGDTIDLFNNFSLQGPFLRLMIEF